MPTPREPDDVIVTPEPKGAPPAAPTTPTTPEPPKPDFETQYRERLKTDHGIEDPDEIGRIRERAARADELERHFQSVQPPQRQGPAPQQRPPFDLAQWQAYARIDPGGAWLQMDRIKEEQRRQEQTSQVAFFESRLRAEREFVAGEAQAERYVREEFPEAYNKSSKLHKEGQAVYTSMPWLHNMGNGFELATQIAAARLGLAPKSKRTSTTTADEVADQSPERGTRKPPAESIDDSKPLTPRQKKMAKDMGVSEKDYRTFQKARATGKNVKVG